MNYSEKSKTELVELLENHAEFLQGEGRRRLKRLSPCRAGYTLYDDVMTSAGLGGITTSKTTVTIEAGTVKPTRNSKPTVYFGGTEVKEGVYFN